MSAGLSENNSNWDKKLSDRVSGPDVPMEDWNTPSDQLWDRIESGLPEEKRRRGVWFWLMGALSVIVALMAIYLIASNIDIPNNSDLGARNIESSEKVSVKDPAETTNQSTAGKIGSPESQDENVGSLTDNSVTGSGSKTIEISPANKSIEQSDPSVVDDQKETNDLFSDAVSKSRSIIKDETVVQSMEEEKLPGDNKIEAIQPSSVSRTPYSRNQEILSSLPGLFPILSLNTKIYIEQIPLEKEIEIGSPKGSFLLGINLAMFGDFAQLNDEYASVVEPFNFRKSSLPGFEAGLSFGYKFNGNWSLLSGLQYRNIRIQSGHNAILAYDPANEVYDGENYYISYDMNYATSYGVLPAEMAIARANDNVQEETQVGVEIDMAQSISLLSIPLLVRRSIYTNRNGSWSMGLAAGPSISFPIANSTEIDHTYSTHEDMHVYHAGIKDELKDLNPVLFNAEVELMSSFDFKRKGSLIVAPFFRYGFTPLYENNQLSSSSNEFGIRTYYLFEL